MSASGCCKSAEGGPPREPLSAGNQLPSKPVTFIRRCFDAVRWMVPTAILILMPKCPVCIAAYVALGTGIGLSMTTANEIRMLLLMLSIGSISYVGMRYVRRLIAAMPAAAHHATQSNSAAGRNSG